MSNHSEKVSSLLTDKYVMVDSGGGGGGVGERVVMTSPVEDPMDLSLICDLKGFCRQNRLPVDHPVRRGLWAKALDVECSSISGTCPCCRYAALSARLFGKYEDDKNANRRTLHLPRFVDPVYQNTYRLNEEGQAAVCRVLLVLKIERPFIMHAPLLYPLTSILLHYYEEHVVFAMVCRLIANRYEYVTLTQSQWSALCELNASLIKKYCSKNAFENLKANNFISPSKLFTTWADWIFGLDQGLTFADVVQMCDCFFVEGIKILLRSVIAIVRIATQTTTKSKSVLKRRKRENTFVPVGTQPGIANDIITIGTMDVKNLRKKGIIDQLDKFEIEARNSLRNLPLKRASIVTGVSPSTTTKFGQVSRRISSAVIHKEQSLARFVDFHDNYNTIPTEKNLLVAELTDNFLLTRSELADLWTYLPASQALYMPKLFYTTKFHGRRLLTLYDCVEYLNSTIILIEPIYFDKTFIETEKREKADIVIGVFIPCPLDERKNAKGFFGNGECFVFRIDRESIDQRVQAFEWIGKRPNATEKERSSMMFIRCDQSGFYVGGGGAGGPAIFLAADLNSVVSYASDTFDNDPLIDPACTTCDVMSVEAIGFV